MEEFSKTVQLEPEMVASELYTARSFNKNTSVIYFFSPLACLVLSEDLKWRQMDTPTLVCLVGIKIKQLIRFPSTICLIFFNQAVTFSRTRTIHTTASIKLKCHSLGLLSRRIRFLFISVNLRHYPE